LGLRVFAYSVDGERGYLVNPSLSFPDEQEQDGPEGCMSFPGLYYDVKRRQNTVARGFTDRGDPVQIVGSATLARCLQHETDHLDAILFIDRMDPATRNLAMRAIREASWSGLAPRPVRVSPHPLDGSARLRVGAAVMREQSGFQSLRHRRCQAIWRGCHIYVAGAT
jgi:peptide deformylase